MHSYSCKRGIRPTDNDLIFAFKCHNSPLQQTINNTQTHGHNKLHRSRETWTPMHEITVNVHH